MRFQVRGLEAQARGFPIVGSSKPPFSKASLCSSMGCHSIRLVRHKAPDPPTWAEQPARRKIRTSRMLLAPRALGPGRRLATGKGPETPYGPGSTSLLIPKSLTVDPLLSEGSPATPPDRPDSPRSVGCVKNQPCASIISVFGFRFAQVNLIMRPMLDHALCGHLVRDTM